jgi:hypothetical protein
MPWWMRAFMRAFMRAEAKAPSFPQSMVRKLESVLKKLVLLKWFF